MQSQNINILYLKVKHQIGMIKMAKLKDEIGIQITCKNFNTYLSLIGSFIVINKIISWQYLMASAVPSTC